MKHLFGNVFRFAGYSIAFFAMVLLCIHFWFKYNSERTIEQLIYWGSNGNLKCSIEKIETNYFNNSIHVKGISIFTVDPSKQSASYKFAVKDFHFRTRSRWDLFVRKQLLIDSIVFNNPEIIIINREAPQKGNSKKIVLFEDLEKLYSTIHKSLDVLNLQLFKINEGKLVVQYNGDPSRPSLLVNHIHFSINKLNIDSSSIKDTSRFIFSEQVVLRILNQKIMLQDDKSTIVFKELLVDSKQKLVRFSGAGIHIFPSVGQRNAFDVQAKKLSVINLDFNTLYQNRLIKADSIFLERPDAIAEFFIAGKARKYGKNHKRILYDSTLNQLPVTFDIGHFVMQNGVASVNIHQAGKTTRLTASNDNVSITGLHLNNSGKRKLQIGGFRYTLRKYNGFLRDSTLRFSFDSLQFMDDQIVLYNLVATTPRNGRNKVIRDYAVPRLEITGMDWLSVIFQNNFKAQEAVLYRPIVKVEKNGILRPEPSGRSKRSIYQNLSLMDKIIDLEKLKIVGGDINLKQADTLELQLKGLNLSIDVDKLGKARTPDELVGSMKKLSFGKAAISTPSVSVTTGCSGFYKNGQKLVFDSIRVSTKHGDIEGIFRQVEVQDFSFENNQLDISRLFWQEGAVHIKTQRQNTEKGKKANRTIWFFIEKMSGNNTWLYLADELLSGQVFLKNISVNRISRESNSNLKTEGVTLTGSDASFNLPAGLLQLDDFDIRDQQNSLARGIVFRRHTPHDSLFVSLPSLSFIPYIEQSFLSKTLTMDSVRLSQPYMMFSSQKGELKTFPSSKAFALPVLNIHGFEILDAQFEVNKGALATAGKHISVQIAQLKTEADHTVRANQVTVKASDVSFSKTNTFRADQDGFMTAELGHFRYHPDSASWDTKLDKLKMKHIDFKSTSPEKNTLLSATNLEVENLKISNSDFKILIPYFINRSGASLKFDSLQWQTDKSHMRLGQFRFEAKQRQLILHSFAINPSKSKVEFDDLLVHRKVYMATKTGEIEANGLGLNEEGLQMSHIRVDDAVLDIYANKLKTPEPAVIQPLPLRLLQKTGFPFQIDKMQLRNARVNYTELSHITKDTGSIDFSSIDARISNISSNPRQESDSVRADISAVFLDKMQLAVALSQSYQDTLGGLRLGIKLGPGELTALNPFLAPLLSVRVKSGYLDSMQMTAIGNEYMSKGLMKLQYHQLKADLLDSGHVSKQKFRTRLIGFIANSIVKDKNSKNERSFGFVRNRHKSTIFYFLRMVVGGVASSVAPASDIFLRKQYKKSLQNVPEQSRLIL